MPDTLDERDAVAYAYVNNVDTLVCPTACKVWAILITGTAVGYFVDVYDGRNAQGRIVLSARDAGNTGRPYPVTSPRPILLHEGLFVHAANAFVTVIYEPLEH